MEIKFDDPRKMGRILNSALEKNIETAIIAAAKKTVPYLLVKKTVKAKQQKIAIAKAAIALGKLICEVKRNRISAKCLLVEDIWQYQDIKLDERVWRSNVAVNTIEQCKNLNLIFDMVKGSWHLQENGKVPLWFWKLEELLIDDTKSHKVKEDFFSNNINTSALQPHCRNVISDNRQKSALIEHWTEMYIQGDKCRLLKCGGCNLNTKDKENRCMINYNKNLIRGIAVGITKRENNWITNFLTILLKDKPEYHLTLVQECLLLQLKEIDSAERELVKSQNFIEKLEAQTISLAWAYLKDKTRAIIPLRDLYLVRQSTLGNLWLLLTSTKETYDMIRALPHIYQEGFYRVIWVERYKKMCEWENSTGITRVKKKGAEEMRSGQRTNLQEPAKKKRKPNDKTELQNSNIWKTLKEKLIKTKKLV
ncbi:15752_t:CDS:2, partial [Gigaspora margarita]